jgi:hypothetical protein
MALGSERDGAPLILGPITRSGAQIRAVATFLSLQHPMQVVTLNPAKVGWCGDKPNSGDQETSRDRVDQEERWRVN